MLLMELIHCWVGGCVELDWLHGTIGFESYHYCCFHPPVMTMMRRMRTMRTTMKEGRMPWFLLCKWSEHFGDLIDCNTAVIWWERLWSFSVAYLDVMLNWDVLMCCKQCGCVKLVELVPLDPLLKWDVMYWFAASGSSSVHLRCGWCLNFRQDTCHCVWLQNVV